MWNTVFAKFTPECKHRYWRSPSIYITRALQTSVSPSPVHKSMFVHNTLSALAAFFLSCLFLTAHPFKRDNLSRLIGCIWCPWYCFLSSKRALSVGFCGVTRNILLLINKTWVVIYVETLDILLLCWHILIYVYLVVIMVYKPWIII